MRGYQLEDLCLFFFAPDERCKGSWQVVRNEQLPGFRQFPKSRVPGKLQQARHPWGLMFQMQSRDEQSREGCRIGHALIFFETADLRIAIAHQKGELALGEFFPFAQVSKQVAKGGKFFR